MKRNQYLNEERFQKNNKKVKIAGILVMILGLCLVGAGIYIHIAASQMEIPPMGASNWFEAKTAQSHKEFLGTAMLMFGVFITIVGCMVRFALGNRREIMAYQVQQGMPIMQEGVEQMSPTMGKAAKEIFRGIKEGMSEDEQIYCKYCGAQIDADSLFCNKCGKPQ